MVFLYCFLCLNLKTMILGERSLSRIVAVTDCRAPWTSAPSLKVALTGNSISEPTSPASFSTRITSPGATRYCLPPVSIIACMESSDFGPDTPSASEPLEVKHQFTTKSEGLATQEYRPRINANERESGLPPADNSHSR